MNLEQAIDRAKVRWGHFGAARIITPKRGKPKYQVGIERPTLGFQGFGEGRTFDEAFIKSSGHLFKAIGGKEKASAVNAGLSKHSDAALSPAASDQKSNRAVEEQEGAELLGEVSRV